MARKFMKGTRGYREAAVRSGCRFFAGYPITPQNEIPEYLARRLPEVGGAFVQGESEVASINMVYGSAGTGTRAMTSSSSCGSSLMSEGHQASARARVCRWSMSTSSAAAPPLAPSSPPSRTIRRPRRPAATAAFR